MFQSCLKAGTQRPKRPLKKGSFMHVCQGLWGLVPLGFVVLEQEKSPDDPTFQSFAPTRDCWRPSPSGAKGDQAPRAEGRGFSNPRFLTGPGPCHGRPRPAPEGTLAAPGLPIWKRDSGRRGEGRPKRPASLLALALPAPGRGSGLESPAGARRLASSGAFKCQPGFRPKQRQPQPPPDRAPPAPRGTRAVASRTTRQPARQASTRPAGSSWCASSASAGSPSAAMRAIPAPGIRFLRSFSRDSWYRGLILVLTFLCYTTFHLSRKPISIVKSELHYNCSSLGFRPNNASNSTTWCDWKPFDQDNYKELFGALDNAFLVAYAIGMYISGIFGERLPLRYYLSGGMLLSGLFTALFGLGYYWNIHQLWYFVFVQILNGLAQTTGWPSVVTCVGNWFGKGKRGLIMGIWNSHTSVGNILGSLIAGIWVSKAWGLSFIVPGIIIAFMGVLCFLFLIEYPEDVDCSPPLHHETSSDEKGLEAGHSISDGSLNVSTNSRENIIDMVEHAKDSGEDREAISFIDALKIPGVIEFSFCLLFAKLVSYTFLYWLPLYIVNVARLSAKEAGDMSTLFDVGGIIGGIVAGLISDYTGGRATTCCAMLILAAPMLFLYNYVGQNGLGTSIAMLIICGGLVNGPYALITTAVSADLGTHESLQGNAKALSTVTAIIDGTGSVGAALGPLLAGLISSSGWDNVFYMLISADMLACLLLSRVVFKEIREWCGCYTRKRGFKEF